MKDLPRREGWQKENILLKGGANEMPISGDKKRCVR